MQNVRLVTSISPIIPEPPKPSMIIPQKKREIVHYIDGTVKEEDLDQLENEIRKKKLFMYSIQRVSSGYFISDVCCGGEDFLITEKDVLDGVKPNKGMRRVDGDAVFELYDMQYDGKLISNISLQK